MPLPQYDTFLPDTTKEAADAYYQAWIDMTPEERVCRAWELSEQNKKLLEEGVRDRHPDYDEEMVRLATIRLWWNDDALFRKVYGIEVEP
ncbi:MAG: hypothetical protein PVH19_15125 [Planctomycetia bacterium]